ncbi:UDP-N-acetylglucosamine 2-epimerase (non-hydrolyzing) [Candidatus Dependentiae bacterium]|nr:UDP-N-acetylglucosamine 2-epimerase (non-hydrolyzing) [Candidatus Dependentiae bacterium]
MRKPIVLVIGTRAEAIKLIPLYLALLKAKLPALLCATFQHAALLEQVCEIFNVTPDFNLHVMKKNQDLFYLTQVILEKTKQVYLQTNPSLVLVHGDTTTTMASALSAFYLQIPIGHIEAGLRTGNMYAPFPEEMNRKVVGQIATYHFAPTAFSTANLLSEGVDRTQVFCTGNTIVDALHMVKEKIETKQIEIDKKIKNKINSCKKNRQKIVLLTAHRRESFNGGLLRIFTSIKQFVQKHEDVAIFFPVHPNPNVKTAVEQAGLCEEKNIFLLEPLLYKDLVYLLTQSDWIATDSGGIQEEAVSLGKRILVLRDITERWEGVWEGSEILVGTNQKRILEEMEKIYLMTDKSVKASSIYGDGNACKRIVSILKNTFSFEQISRKPRSSRVVFEIRQDEKSVSRDSNG